MTDNHSITRWLWVRHFPVASCGVYVGQSDVEAVLPPLSSPHNISISEVDLGTAVWVVSPLIRARQTMDWLRQSLQISGGEIIAVPELMEQSFGQWEGRRYEDIQLGDVSPETIRPPDGETFEDITQRVHHWMDKALTQYVGRTVIAVCHAGAIRAALSHALAIAPGASLRFQLDYGSLTETRYIRHENRFIGQVEQVNAPITSQ